MIALAVAAWIVAGGIVTVAAMLGLIGGDATGPWAMAYAFLGASGVWIGIALRRRRDRLMVAMGSMALAVAYIAVGAYLAGNPAFTVIRVWPVLIGGGLIAGLASTSVVARRLRLRVQAGSHRHAR